MDTKQIPEQTAPPGAPRSYLALGTPVRYHECLKKFDVEEPPFIGWKRSALDESRKGVVVGKRMRWSGEYVEGYEHESFAYPLEREYSPPYRRHDVGHHCYLVAYDLHRKPDIVLSDDILLSVAE